MSAGEPLLKARDVAELLDLEVATVVDHAQRGDLPGFRLYGRAGGPLRFRLSEIEDWLQRCRFGNVQGGKRNGSAPRQRPEPDTRRERPRATPTLHPLRRE